MNKWHLRFLRLAYLGLAAILPVYALADYNATQGAGTIFRAFDSTHGGSALCAAATTQCQAVGLINSAGAEIGTAGAPVRVDPTGTTPQPVNATQTGTWTVQPGNTANTTPWLEIIRDAAGNARGANVNASNQLSVSCDNGCAATTSITGWAGSTLGAITTYGTAPAGLVPGVNAFVTNATPLGQAVMASSSPVVIASNQSAVPVTTQTSDACTNGNKTNLPISQNGTASVQLVALSGATVIYVCSLSLVAAGATTVAITTGTGTACATGNAAVIGTTTALIANSMAFAANGGLTLGSGMGTIAKGLASNELCMVLGTNVFVSGNLTYVQQ